MIPFSTFKYLGFVIKRYQSWFGYLKYFSVGKDAIHARKTQ